MECIRVLLISSFCANSTDPTLTLSLQRKTSRSNVESPSREASGGDSAVDTAAGPEKDEKQEDVQAVPAGQASETASTAKSTDKDKKNKLQEEQENTEEEMKPLIELLKNRDDLEMDYHLALGLESFQVELLGILYEFMNKKDTKIEDREIVSQGTSIWMSCLASDPKLLHRIYDDFQKIQEMDPAHQDDFEPP